MSTGAAVPKIYSPGREAARYHQRHPGAGSMWRRMRDAGFAKITQFGGNPMWGSVIGKLYLEGVLTETEASAGRLYAQVCGRYERYHPVADRITHTPRSPAWEGGFGGSFDVVAHHENNGSIKEYERKAKAARKAWVKLQTCVPDAARDAVEEVCLYDREISSQFLADLKTILGAIAHKFGLRAPPPEQDQIRRKKAQRAVNIARRVESAVHSALAQFRADHIRPAQFQIGIVGRKHERGFTLYSEMVGKTQHHTTVLIAISPNELPAVIDAAFLTALSKEGLEEKPREQSGAPPSGGQ